MAILTRKQIWLAPFSLEMCERRAGTARQVTLSVSNHGAKGCTAPAVALIRSASVMMEDKSFIFLEFYFSVVCSLQSNLGFTQVLLDLTQHVRVAPQQHGEFLVISKKEKSSKSRKTLSQTRPALLHTHKRLFQSPSDGCSSCRVILCLTSQIRTQTANLHA
jgi:hypothetical protein